MQRAIRSVQSHPSVHDVNIRLTCQGNSQGWFDSKKLERVFYNLLLNACQAVPPEAGKIEINIQQSPDSLEISISDNGSGIPAHLHDKIFEPFASYGKENGTGLGLTIVHKILEEHGGTIKLASSSPGQTTFQITIPIDSNPDTNGRDDMSLTTLLPENEV